MAPPCKDDFERCSELRQWCLSHSGERPHRRSNPIHAAETSLALWLDRALVRRTRVFNNRPSCKLLTASETAHLNSILEQFEASHEGGRDDVATEPATEARLQHSGGPKPLKRLAPAHAAFAAASAVANKARVADPSTRRRGGNRNRQRIKELQRKKYCTSSQAFTRIVRDTAASINPNMKFQSESLIALHKAAEDYLCAVLADSARCQQHTKRQTMIPEDMALATQLRRNDGDHLLFGWEPASLGRHRKAGGSRARKQARDGNGPAKRRRQATVLTKTAVFEARDQHVAMHRAEEVRRRHLTEGLLF